MSDITRERSPHWPAVQHAHLQIEPLCQACSTDQNLNVHHKKPYHLYPDLELEPTNLITLCMENKCHILIGHGNNFKQYNPNVVEDAATIKANTNLLTEVAERAKLNRLSE